MNGVPQPRATGFASTLGSSILHLLEQFQTDSKAARLKEFLESSVLKENNGIEGGMCLYLESVVLVRHKNSSAQQVEKIFLTLNHGHYSFSGCV